jgi:HEAT repeat protein
MYYDVKALSKNIKPIIIVLAISFCLLPVRCLQAADVNVLVQQLKNEDLLIRLNTIMALGETRDARAVEPLISTLKDESCVCTAANSLVKIGNPAVEPLIAALKDDKPIVRRNAAKALGEIKDVSAVKPLIFALKDKDLTVRWNAAKALGEIKDASAVEPLIEAQKDESPIVRKNAVMALRDMGKTEAVIADILY